jgi:hypothetical protein
MSIFTKKKKDQLQVIQDVVKEGMRNDGRATKFWIDKVAPEIKVQYPNYLSYEAHIPELKEIILQLRMEILPEKEREELAIAKGKPASKTTAFKSLPPDVQERVQSARAELTRHTSYVHRLVTERLPKYCYDRVPAELVDDVEPILQALSSVNARRDAEEKKKDNITSSEVAQQAQRHLTAGHIHDSAKATSKEADQWEIQPGGINGNLRVGELYPIFDMIVNRGLRTLCLSHLRIINP